MSSVWEGLEQLVYQGGQLGMSPEEAARHAAETLAHRKNLQEQEARRKVLWQRLGGTKETMLYVYEGSNCFYNVSVAYGVSWDGYHVAVEITIGGDGYPSRFDFRPSSALRLLKRIEQESQAETMQFTVERDGYSHLTMGIRGDFALSQETVRNLAVWLERECPLLEQLVQGDTAMSLFDIESMYPPLLKDGKPTFACTDVDSIFTNTTIAASGTLTLADVERWFDLMRSEPLQPAMQIMSPWLYDHYDEIQETARKESQERLRRYRKYQRRKAWGLAHKKRHRRRR